MPKRPKLEAVEIRNNGVPTWMVSIPPDLSASGNRERKYFTDPKQAETLAKRLRGDYAKGLRGGIIPAKLASEASEAAKLLAPYGISLLDAAKSIAAQQKAKGSTETFRDRFDRFVKEQEVHWRARYTSDMAKIPRWVGSDFMETRVGEITPEKVAAALRANGAGAASTVKARSARVLSVVAGRGKQKRSLNIAIMTTSQCAAMLRACRSVEERRAAALLLFAGIRPSVADGEISRLDWSDVGAEQIYIGHETSKTGTDRFIPITPRLRRLLAGRPTEGTVMPPNWKRRFTELRAKAGVSDSQDITRHTFASHFLAWKGEDATKAAMGHTAGSSTLFRHYRRAVIEEQGRRYFVGPEKAMQDKVVGIAKGRKGA